VARRLVLSAAALFAALTLGGCNTAQFCEERSLLGFLFCDPALVDSDPSGPKTAISKTSVFDGSSNFVPVVDQDLLFAAKTVGADDPLYPEGYIAREEWDMDGDGQYERSYPYGGSSFVYAFTEKGHHTVRLRVTDVEGKSVEQQDEFEVKVSEYSPRNRPRAAITMSNQTPRVGEKVTLSASGSSDPDGRIVGYEWHLWNDVVHTTEPTLEYTFKEPRTNNAIVQVTDDDGLWDQAAIAYRVGDEGEGFPLAGITFEPNPATAGDRVVFRSTSSDPGGSLVRYQWDLDGDGVYDRDTTENVAVERTCDVPGVYNVHLRVTDNDGWPGDAYDQVDVQHREHCEPGSCSTPGGVLRASFSPFAGPAPAAANKNRFFARLSVNKVSTRGARSRRGRRSRTLRGVRAAGTLRGGIAGPPGQPAPTAPKSIAGFLQSSWSGNLDLTALTSGHRHKATALVLARPRLRSAGRVCVRIALSASPGKPGRGTFRVVGGTGPAARLRAKGRVGFDLRPKGQVVLGGTIAADKGRARPLPRGCR
jgi:hypothetical protein